LAPSDILEAVAHGPSVAATVFGRRSLLLDGRVLVDVIPETEKHLILGRATDNNGVVRYLWPPDFTDFPCWAGEWNDECEGWFNRRWEEIHAMGGAVPKSLSTWKDARKYNRRDKAPWKELLPSALDILFEHTKSRWDGRRAVDIVLPEVL